MTLFLLAVGFVSMLGQMVILRGLLATFLAKNSNPLKIPIIRFIIGQKVRVNGGTIQTQKKITITIDEGLFEQVEQAAKRYHISRNYLAQESLSLWLKKKTESLMAKGYREMAEEDRKTAELTLEAQWEIQ